MPKRPGQTNAKIKASARANGAKGGRPPLVAVAAGKRAAKVGRQALSALARWQKARAGTQEQIEIAKRTENQVRAKELIPAAQVRAWGLRLVSGLRREIDALPTMVDGTGLSEEVTDATRKAIVAIANRCRARLASAPELVPPEKAS